MKHIFVALMMLMFGALSAPAQVRFGGGAQGGVSVAAFPEPVKEIYSIGVGGGVHGRVDVSDAFAIRLNADYMRFAADKDKLVNRFVTIPELGNLTAEGFNASFFSVAANAVGKITTGSSWRPYGLAGIGAHFTSVSDMTLKSNGQTILTATGNGTETNFSLNVGIGSEFAVGGVKLFAEAKYVTIFTSGKNTSYIPVTVGVTL